MCGSWWRPGKASSPRGGRLLAHRSKLIPDHSVTLGERLDPLPSCCKLCTYSLCGAFYSADLNTVVFSLPAPSACPFTPPLPPPPAHLFLSFPGPN